MSHTSPPPLCNPAWLVLYMLAAKETSNPVPFDPAGRCPTV